MIKTPKNNIFIFLTVSNIFSLFKQGIFFLENILFKYCLRYKNLIKT